jgi:hypothetical protein
MKKLFLLTLVILTISCQREKMNEVGVGYNKSLIAPPVNDLPEPGNKSEDNSLNKESSDNSIVKSILKQTNAGQADESIINKIDNDSGYKTDENFFQWLFKSKS